MFYIDNFVFSTSLFLKNQTKFGLTGWRNDRDPFLTFVDFFRRAAT